MDHDLQRCRGTALDEPGAVPVVGRVRLQPCRTHRQPI